MNRARTIGIIRQLSAFGPLPKRRARLPRPVPPTAIALAYFNALSPVVERARAEAHDVLPDILHELRTLRFRQGRTDAPGGGSIGLGRAAQLGEKAAEREKRRALAEAGRTGRALESATKEGRAARAVLDAAARRFAAGLKPSELHDVARLFGARADKHAQEQLDHQVRAAMGISLASIERPTVDRIDGWAAVNVDLIVTVPERYFDRLRLDVEDAFEAGTHPETLAEDFADRYDMAIDDARRIARDQIGRLAAQVNQDRQESLGVDSFVWRCVRDGRVCDECFELEGQTFTWAEGADGVRPGDCHPMDRCFAEPLLDEIVASLDA